MSERFMPILLDRKSAAELIGVSIRTFDNFRDLPGFPQPIQLAGPRWRRAAIEAWLIKCERPADVSKPSKKSKRTARNHG